MLVVGMLELVCSAGDETGLRAPIATAAIPSDLLAGVYPKSALAACFGV